MGLYKSFRNLSLGLKLAVMMVIGLALLVAAIILVLVLSAQNMTLQAGKGRAQQEAEVVQSQLGEARQDLLASAEFLLSRLPLENALISGESASSIRSKMVIGVRGGMDADNLAMVDANGVYITGVQSRGGDIIISPQQDDLIGLALNGTQATGLLLEANGSRLWVAAVIPLRDLQNEVAGALLTAELVDDEFLEEINFSRDDVHLALVADGEILAQDFPSQDVLNAFAGPLTAEPTFSAGESIIADDLFLGPEGVPYALGHMPVTETDASIAVMVDMEELHSFRRQLVRNTGVILVSLALAITMGILLFSRFSITGPIQKLRSAAERMAEGDYDQLADVTSQDEIGQLATAFNSMTIQLRRTLENLGERTEDLERRSTQLQASTEVSQAATSILDVDQLIQRAVDLIRGRFDLYYVGLFLLDEAGEWAVLQAGTGEVGQLMRERGHRIRVGEGMVGWSIAHGQARVAEQAGADAIRLATEELPGTRSEAALVLRSRGQVLGALTVQSDKKGAFDEETITILQTMADQVAVAIDNARLLAETETALEAERRAYRQLSRQAWLELTREQANLDYLCNPAGVRHTRGEWAPEMVEARRTGQIVRDDGMTVVIPVKMRDQVIGAVRMRKSDGDRPWTAEEEALMETLVERLGTALESARLYRDIQRRAAREQVASRISARMRETLDLEDVLRTTTEEIGRSLDLHDVTIRLTTGDGDEG